MHRTAVPALASRAPVDLVLQQLRWWPEGNYRALSSEQWEAHCPACGGRYQLTVHELLPDGPVALRCATGCPSERIAALLQALERLHRAAEELKALGAWDYENDRPAVALQADA